MPKFLADSTRLPACGNTGTAAPKFLSAKTRIALTFLASAAFYTLPQISNLTPSMALAQTLGNGSLPQTNPNAQLLLKADRLIYDNDNQKVTAQGSVQLDYDGYQVVADEVTYNQSTNKVRATGNVEILEPNGNRIYADEIDLTDDFSAGFVNALRVETPDNTRFAAESAERFGDQKTVFRHGVYTACEPCKEKPDRAPLWQIKAQQVILNGKTKTISYRRARFELFGIPIAYVPYFTHADSSVKRKTGFLNPTLGFKSGLGYWYRQPFFIKTGETHDLTLAATGFTEQGLMVDGRWRHQLENGFYTIKAAGISQDDPDAFSTEPDNVEIDRGMIASEGRFNINPRWAFGWNLLAQSDSNFSRTYRLSGYRSYSITNDVFLRGLADKSYFKLSANQYLVQNDTIIGNGTAFSFEGNQAFVRPQLDYNFVTTDTLSGGEVSLDLNVTSLERDTLSTITPTNGDVRTHGFNGETTRASADLQWRKTINASGLAITPSLSLRGDWTSTNGFAASAGPVLTDGEYSRFMPTAGLEVSYPVLARLADSSHIFTPTANIFLRPDLAFDGVAPNEDAQSLVFDASTLFDRDKFSGYDRIESGTRTNLGLRYVGEFGNGLSISGLVGQSFHLGGENPYANTNDLANVGQESGLETDASDYVAALAFSNQSRYGVNLNARFDNNDFSVRRSEAAITFGGSIFSGSANVTYIASQPDYGFEKDRTQVGFFTSVKLAENWSAYGGAQYDIEDNLFVYNSVGLSYTDECFILSLGFNEIRSSSTTDVDRSISFKLSFRTLGDIEGSVDPAQFTSPNVSDDG
ncbi:MAG: LPS-assembly protein LptD [Pseudomonadota bacterium]